MLIAIDGVAANDENRVGVSMYTLELLRYFHTQANEKLQFTIYLKNPPRADLPKKTEYFRYRVVGGSFLWSRLFFPLALMRDPKPDIFFSPAHYLPSFVPCPAVVTIHDLAYEYYPAEFLKKDLYKLKNWTKSAVNKSRAVIAVSQNTKSDILKYYQTPSERVKVIYNGFRSKSEFLNSKSETISKFKILNSKFLLFVGTLQPRKNIAILIEAFSTVVKSNKDLKLIIVGKRGWLYNSIFQKVSDLGLENKIKFTGYLPDSELAILYKNAAMMVLPSLYEGFGIPILEAMAAGCPVITSNVSSLPEIAGEAALYFNPHDSVELAGKIDMILKDKSMRDDLIKKGKARVGRFSWEKCGKETLELLTNV